MAYIKCTNINNTVDTQSGRRSYKLLELNYRDSRPIYEQIVDGVSRLLVTGVLKPGDKLPTVRGLASQLAINPNTIQRAYRELEAEGYIYSVPGKGSFAAGKDEVDASRAGQLLKQLQETVRELGYLGYSTESLCDRIRKGDKS